MATPSNNSPSASKSKHGPERLPAIRSLNRNGSFNVVRPHDTPLADIYHRLLSLTWGRFIADVIAFYLLVNVVFGLAYFACGPGQFVGMPEHEGFRRFLDCYFFSVQTFATIGYGHVAPGSLAVNLVVTVEALAGLLTVSLATGLLFARFSKPTARIRFSRNAIVGNHDGQLSFFFRMSNERGNLISQAEVGLSLLIDERTAEGDWYRTFYDLDLERAETPMFALSWTVVHPITEKSPLFRHTDETLRQAHVEILATVTGIDSTTSQDIHARFSYVPDEIAWHKRFVDVISRGPEGRISVDLTRFDDLE
ncbi:MAG: ATP-sensitive inward rectifier potassium channel 10 [Deltaproteobacteria bacterium]|nr:ATP-sensitive inward rectifier potassium channel 10 [Deltaproteobacteria bacterium]